MKGIQSRVVSCGPEGWSEPDVFTVPSIPLPIINADDNFGYSLGIKLTKDCKDKIRAFNPTIIHFTVPDFLALDALRWAKSEVSIHAKKRSTHLLDLTFRISFPYVADTGYRNLAFKLLGLFEILPFGLDSYTSGKIHS